MSARSSKRKKSKTKSNNKLKHSKPSFRKYETKEEVEAMLLPAPSSVTDWISGQTVQKMKALDAKDIQKFAKQMGRKAVKWLRKGLRASYLSPEIKRVCKELLGVQYFTANLTPMELFNELQDDCKTAALDIGNELHEYYTENELDKSLGALDLKQMKEFNGNRRQDAPRVGLVCFFFSPSLSLFYTYTNSPTQYIYIHSLFLHMARIGLDLSKRV